MAVSTVAKEVNESLGSILKALFDTVESLEGSMWKDILEAKVIFDKGSKREESTESQSYNKYSLSDQEEKRTSENTWKPFDDEKDFESETYDNLSFDTEEVSTTDSPIKAW